MATKKAGAPRTGKKKPTAKKASARVVKEVTVEPKEPSGPPTLPFEIDPQKIEASLNKLKDQVVVLAKKGRYTKVRFKFRGKQLLPDIPLAAVVAVEGATFYWAGVLRALVFTLAGGTVIDVEFVNDSEKELARGKQLLLSGDLDDALAAFQKAVDMDEENPNVHLNLGIALKLKGDHPNARKALERALALDPKGPAAAEAERLLKTLTTAMVVAQ
ncbi:MAG TPA: tetratricopeptide repeat protein [Archangium sp.]